jgi:hypothetical protein
MKAMNQLRGRNLSHIGCTLGLTIGLFLGLVAAILVLQVSDQAQSAAMVAFGVITIGLGILGFYLGGVTTRRLWGDHRPPR